MIRWSSSQKLVLTVIAVMAWGFFLWRAVEVFKPGVNSAAVFNSDCAVPVLMSNDERPITLFNFYYYGHDRWGGWPFLIAQGIRRVTGYRWSGQNLSIIQTIWLFIGAIVMAALSRHDRVIVALAFLLSVCVFGDTHHQIFWLSHVYAWQVTALLLSWYSLRRWFDRDADSKKPQPKRALGLVPILVFSYLAIWSSIASIPFLLFLVALEALRARLKKDWRRPDGTWLKSFARGLVPVVAASVAERLQVIFYHRYAINHFGLDFRTPLRLDVGFLIQNLGMQLGNLTRPFWWPINLIAALTALALISVVIHTWSKGRKRFLEKLKEITANDTAVVCIGTYGIALINFVLAVTVSHVRINQYDERYLVLTNLFGAVSGILILFLLLNSLARQSLIRKYGRAAFLLIGIGLLLARFPTRIYRPEYRSFEEAALALAQKSPRGILLGDYWGVYVFASLQPVNTMTPVPFNEEENRMPWTREMVRGASQVVVQHSGGKLKPPEHLYLYGGWFRLAEPRWYDNEAFAFARYVTDNAQSKTVESVFGTGLLVRQSFQHILDREPEEAELAKSTALINDCHGERVCIRERNIAVDLNLLHSLEFQSRGGFIFQLYLAALGRAPKYDEWENDRKNVAATGKNGAAAFTEDWTQQAEFLARYPASLTNREYVDKLFETAGQAVDAAQRAALIKNLSEGSATRGSTLTEIISQSRRAAENDEALVTLCYFIYLKRDPDTDGFNYWLQTLRSGSKAETFVVGGFLNSGEYRAKFPRP